MIHCWNIVLCSEILDQNRPVCWSIVVKEKSTVGSPFSETFPSQCNSKATEGANVHLFIHCCTFGDELATVNALAVKKNLAA